LQQTLLVIFQYFLTQKLFLCLLGHIFTGSVVEASRNSLPRKVKYISLLIILFVIKMSFLG